MTGLSPMQDPYRVHVPPFKQHSWGTPDELSGTQMCQGPWCAASRLKDGTINEPPDYKREFFIGGYEPS